MADFAPAVAILLKHEGGYARKDAGEAGAVNFGITQKYVLGTNRAKTWDDAGEFILQLQMEQAEEIYKQDFWERHNLGSIVLQKFATILLSMMVNIGEGTAVKQLQKALGVTVDGIFGPKTLAALNDAGPEFAAAWQKQLSVYYNRIAPVVGPKYLAGWLKRLKCLFEEG